MTGRDPLDDLRHLAEAGERAARPSEPEEIRARGDRRGRRRRIGAAVGALAVAILAGVIGGNVVTQSGVLPTVPDPAGTPGVTARPEQPITEANLPTEQDLEWEKPGDWKISDTYPGSGSDVASECLQQKPDSLGARQTYFRTYLMGEDYGSATALEFDTADAARQAYGTLTRWGDECEQTLKDRDHERVKVLDWVDVPTDHGEAKFRVILADQTEDPKRVQTMDQEYGLILSGRRVELVVLTLRAGGDEHHWSADQQQAEDTGLPLDPMVRSLPKAAARLAGEPLEPTPSPEPARRLSEKQLVRPGDLPEYEGLKAIEFKRNARPSKRPSNCFPESLDSLNPTDNLIRSFRYQVSDPDASEDPSAPMADEPGIYTVALQFADEEEATRAYETVSGWIESCADTLDEEGFRSPVGGPVTGFDQWYPVRGDVDSAQFTEYTYQRPDVDDDMGFFEGVGLVRVGDRLAIGITVVYGMDHNWDADPDDKVAGPHPLADILPVAAKRLKG